MSLSNLLVESEYTGDASTTTFAITFALKTNSQIKVTVGGTLQTLGVNYSLTGSPATAVVFGSAPAAAAAIRIYRDTPLTQSLNLVSNGTFAEEDVESRFDLLVMMIQELEARVEELEA